MVGLNINIHHAHINAVACPTLLLHFVDIVQIKTLHRQRIAIAQKERQSERGK